MDSQQTQYPNSNTKQNYRNASNLQNKQMITKNYSQFQLPITQSFPPKSMKQRNRRYAKLKKLSQQGYFQQDQIMLKYPHLYHQFVGQYKKSSNFNKFVSISQFLQAQIISTQYRNLLKTDNNNKTQENGNNLQMEEQNETKNGIQQQKQDDQSEMEMKSQENQNEQDQNPYEQQLQSVQQQDLQMLQQSLLDFIKEQFIEGKLPDFDYKKIDQDQSLDDFKQMDQDQQQKYFNQGLGQNQDDPQNNTGIQDF